MEIDDFRSDSYNLDQLLKDFRLSSGFAHFLNKESFDYDILIGNIRMEKYLLTKIKCSQCLTPQDKRLIYVIEQAIYSEFKEFKRLPISHQNCQIIDKCISATNQMHCIKRGPALTFPMMLSLHDCKSIKERYNLFRYYMLIVDNEDNLAIETYLDEYYDLKRSLGDSLQVVADTITQTQKVDSGLESFERRSLAEINQQFIITHYNSDSDSRKLLERLNGQECFGHRMSKATVLENFLVSDKDSQVTNDVVMNGVDGKQRTIILALNQDDRAFESMTANSTGNEQRTKVLKSPAALVEHIFIKDDCTELVQLSLTVDFNGSRKQTNQFRDEDVTETQTSCKGPNLKAGDFGFWPKWPNISGNVSKIKHM